VVVLEGELGGQHHFRVEPEICGLRWLVGGYGHTSLHDQRLPIGIWVVRVAFHVDSRNRGNEVPIIR
jgi:hypothetical protein